MLFSKSAEYAIQAMIYLAEKNSPKPVLIKEIANAHQIPPLFLSKISQTLVKYHLLTAVRGRNGGVLLARPANEIYIKQIIQAVDGPGPESEQCIIGLDDCSDEQPCPFHHKWHIIQEQINNMLEEEDLADLAQRVVEKRKLMRGNGIPDLISAVKK